MNLKSDSPVEFVKGVGPQKGKALREALQIETVHQLLEYYPFRYIDKTRFTAISEAGMDGQLYQFKGFLRGLDEKGFGKGKRLTGLLEDETGAMELIWFQNYQWIRSKLEVGKEYIVFGRIKITGLFKSMAHPEIELFHAESLHQVLRWEPVYPSNEKLAQKGLETRAFRKILFNALSQMDPASIEDRLPQYILEKLKLPPLFECLRNLHFPKDESTLQRARQRLKFEELFFLQLRLVRNMVLRKQKSEGHPMKLLTGAFNAFYPAHLPFELTNAQRRVLNEIQNDLASGIQMNRLLQGDVGSGKTIIALLSMLVAISSGYQCCIMAPTEILAQQHYQSIRALLEPIQLECALLTSSIKGAERKRILEALARNELKILIGTHAVIEEAVQFAKLGLIVIDEQHRFGVQQRARLWAKAADLPPHILVMTATPIPRTLAMSLYGDLDVSVIDELPPGRKPIHTMHFTEALRGKLYEFMTQQIADGRQVYIVFPLIEESEKLDLENLEMGYEKLLSYFPLPKYQISVVHGKLRPRDKELEMQRFVKGITHIMVATTVIEVGVNVPNASIMVIENAERFGLSQLHQLRGRVGRGANQSFCILMTSNQLSKEAKLRIQTMCQTNDGFRIAEADLQLRGPGDLDGTRQSGLLQLKMANILEDQKILFSARKFAEAILKKDPELTNPINQLLRKYIHLSQEELLGRIS